MILIGLLIIAIVLISSNNNWSSHIPYPLRKSPPEEILRQRFARGDINWEEYNHILKALNEG